MTLNLLGLLDEIRCQAIDWAKHGWVDLGSIVDEILPEPLDPSALLPIATGSACGTDRDLSIRLSAAMVLIALVLRIVDDSADRDNPDALYRSVGVDRSLNAALSLSAIVTHQLLRLPLLPHRHDRLLDHYFHSLMQVCSGQDQDIRHLSTQLSGYRKVVNAKTVSAYKFAAASSAYVGTDDVDKISKCEACGSSLGWMIQILDDIEAMWFPDGPSDLLCGRLTFPVFYGFSLEVPQSQDLKRLCLDPRLNHTEILALLDEMQVRASLIQLALDYRDQALDSLGSPMHPIGQQMLETWLNWLWRDGKRLLT